MARRAWKLLYRHSPPCIVLADQALPKALELGDAAAEGWAHLVRGLHLIWYATPQQAANELVEAQRCFTATRDRAGHLLAEVGIARCLWREGKYRDSLERVLPLRAEGRVVGVVGLSGAPEGIRQHAELVRMAAETMLEQARLMQVLARDERLGEAALPSLALVAVQSVVQPVAVRRLAHTKINIIRP